MSRFAFEVACEFKCASASWRFQKGFFLPASLPLFGAPSTETSWGLWLFAPLFLSFLFLEKKERVKWEGKKKEGPGRC